MVKLTKIYTRTGDDGTTGLGTGERVSKGDLRVEAYGTVDEANAAVGVAQASASRSEGSGASAIGAILSSVSHDLFDVGADLCVPVSSDERPGSRLRVGDKQTQRLEALIDEHNAGLGPLGSFILPGGSVLSAHLHVARTVVRRAERLVVRLHECEPEMTNSETVRYLNRLSDLLFVLCRVANDNGRTDVLWKPGANR